MIALDLPGHGQSDTRLPGASLADLAGFVAAFLDRLDVERVHAVGHSMGGAIAARLALDQPKRVASLARIKRAVSRGRPTYQLTAEFHRLLARAAHNGVLYRVSQMLLRPTLAEGVRVERELPDVAAQEHETHLRLYMAIRDRDEAAARALMREHLEIAHGWEDEIAALKASPASSMTAVTS